MKLQIIPIQAKHDAFIKQIITEVGKEFGAVGDGYGPADKEVQAMSQYYDPIKGSTYLVALADDKVVGGCGIASFNSSKNVSELRKLFLLPEARGKGVGKELTKLCIDFARSSNYQRCYLDTLSNMTTAVKMYEKMGFRFLEDPLEGVIHTGCDTWMMLDL